MSLINNNDPVVAAPANSIFRDYWVEAPTADEELPEEEEILSEFNPDHSGEL